MIITDNSSTLAVNASAETVLTAVKVESKNGKWVAFGQSVEVALDNYNLVKAGNSKGYKDKQMADLVNKSS